MNDKASGLVYLNARHYNPAIGRFMQQDSCRGEVGEALSHNLTTYCNNNPLKYVDPSGHAAFWITDSNALLGLGHASLLIENSNSWYYYYFGMDFQNPKITVKNWLSFDVDFSSTIVLKRCNNKIVDSKKKTVSLSNLNLFVHNLSGKEKYNGNYDKAIYFDDSSVTSKDVYLKAKNIKSTRRKYNLKTNNCVHSSLKALITGITNSKLKTKLSTYCNQDWLKPNDAHSKIIKYRSAVI